MNCYEGIMTLDGDLSAGGEKEHYLGKLHRFMCKKLGKGHVGDQRQYLYYRWPGQDYVFVRSAVAMPEMGIVDEVSVEMSEGQELFVKVPVRAIRRSGERRKVLVVPESEMEIHGTELLERNGFAVLLCATSKDLCGVLDRESRKEAFNYYELSARVRVVDAEKAAHAYCSGLGRGKAFGMGLMLCQPV
ncbi:type I-E CRISPR-associated protein Cas6/Cse3/CasE [Ferrimonas marina]|uniref:CRISPR associated protein n=1 Tax=Ferrimonas marina TaxID=299255 RepID=A0A1M5TXZ6_9GAMM|nr:type I-E CRISPR-associated protein Cas6/Cse3/CasE [Ferrimonas marina]SHH55657.1 CRISPR associated protein [Ferrimonas marina]